MDLAKFHASPHPLGVPMTPGQLALEFVVGVKQD